MAVVGDEAEKQLREITECSICMNAFTDPRMLPCIHTFCFECLKRTGEAERKEPGDRMPCPLCRKQFTIPLKGVIGLQRNFFMVNFLEYKTTLKRNLPSVKTGKETEKEMKRMANVKCCTKHKQKMLDYYCADCKKIVCVSCFVEGHKLHDCKDVATVEEEFRQRIKEAGRKSSDNARAIMSLRKSAETMKIDFLKKIEQSETAIIKRSEELKDMIEKHTALVLNDLSVMKSLNLKKIESQMDEIERGCTILTSFEAYCTELSSKGSASDVCCSIDELIVRATELEREHEEFIGRPYQTVEVSFQATDLEDVLQNEKGNLVGNVENIMVRSDIFAVVVGLKSDVVRINLHRPNEISTEQQIPTKMTSGAVAAVCCNTMYVAGIGVNHNEIWKYDSTSGWGKCASFVQGRRSHSAAFIDEVLYICGGIDVFNINVLGSVEAYNTITDRCKVVGKLAHFVHSSGNCVSYRNSLYIFGGLDGDYEGFNHVQVYNPKANTCRVIHNPIPQTYELMRAVLWEASVILLGCETCIIFNIETRTWQVREQFKSYGPNFSLVLQNEKVFIIGGGVGGKDVRYVPLRNILANKPTEWKIHATFPKPILAQTSGNLSFPI